MGVREGLLALLDAEPSHGYGLKAQFEQITGGVWPLNVGQVYSTLDRLERDGLVAATVDADEQRSWRLTDEGRDALGAWWWAVPGDEPPPRDELVLRCCWRWPTTVSSWRSVARRVDEYGRRS